MSIGIIIMYWHNTAKYIIHIIFVYLLTSNCVKYISLRYRSSKLYVIVIILILNIITDLDYMFIIIIICINLFIKILIVILLIFIYIYA